MGSTPVHTYCSLKDLLKNQPSPIPKFKNHSYSRTKPELEDVYTNIPLDVSILESLSPSKKPSYQVANAGRGKGKMCAKEEEPPQMVDSSICCICNREMNKERFEEEKIFFDAEEDVVSSVVSSDGEDEEVKASFANGSMNGVENKEAETKEAVESDEESEVKAVVVESEEETEEKKVVESDEDIGAEEEKKGVKKSEEF